MMPVGERTPKPDTREKMIDKVSIDLQSLMTLLDNATNALSQGYHVQNRNQLTEAVAAGNEQADAYYASISPYKSRQEIEANIKSDALIAPQYLMTLLESTREAFNGGRFTQQSEVVRLSIGYAENAIENHVVDESCNPEVKGQHTPISTETVDLGLTENGIADRILNWIAYSDNKGISSKAIAFTALGKMSEDRFQATPRDIHDFRRCMLLLEKVPEVYDLGLMRLAEQYPDWKNLVDVWEALTVTIIREVDDDWRTNRMTAPEASAILEKALQQ